MSRYKVDADYEVLYVEAMKERRRWLKMGRGKKSVKILRRCRV